MTINEKINNGIMFSKCFSRFTCITLQKRQLCFLRIIEFDKARVIFFQHFLTFLLVAFFVPTCSICNKDHLRGASTRNAHMVNIKLNPIENGVYILEEVSFWMLTTRWVSPLMDQGVPEDTCSQVLRSTSVDL